MKSSRHTFFGRLLRGAAIVLALSGALSAQDWWARFGVQGSLSAIGSCEVPNAPAPEDGSARGLGIFWEAPFTDNLYHVVGLQFNFAGHEGNYMAVTTMGVIYDLQYYQMGWQRGLYGLAGLSYLYCQRHGNWFSGYDNYGYYEYSGSKIGLDLGVGFYFTDHLGAEAKLVLATDSWSYIQLSAKWRF